MAEITIFRGDELAGRIAVDRPLVTVGRDADNTVALQDMSVSRHHARIVSEGGLLRIEDLGSTNRTFVNEQPVRAQILRDGDRIRIGRYRIEIHLSAAESFRSGSVRVRIPHEDSSSEAQRRIVCEQDIDSSGLEVEEGQRLAQLYEMSQTLNTLESVDAHLRKSLDRIIGYLGADRCCVLLASGGGSEMVPFCSRRRPGVDKSVPFEVSRTIINHAVKTRHAVLTEDAQADDRFLTGESIILANTRSAMGVPLIHGDQILGVLFLDRFMSPAPFSSSDLLFLSAIANQMAAWLANARLFRDVLSEKEKLLAVFAGMSDGLVITDQEFRVQDSNNAAYAVFGGDVRGSNLFDLLEGFETSQDPDRLRLSGTQANEFTVLRRSGEEIVSYSVHFTPFSYPGSGRMGFVFLFRDTSEMKRLEMLKSEFITHVAHKLRTPLAVVMGNLSLLEAAEVGGSANRDDDGRDERAEMFEGVQHGVERLCELVNKFIEYAELEMRQSLIPSQAAPVDVGPLLKSALEMYQGVLREKSTEVQVSLPRFLPKVQLSADHAVKAFSNIIENAAKFVEPGGKVNIAVEVGEGVLRILFTDTGPGIPEGETTAIFHSFHQVDPQRTGQVPGAGLGLPIARQIIDAHGGRISIESPFGFVDHGTRVCVEFPVPSQADADRMTDVQIVPPTVGLA